MHIPPHAFDDAVTVPTPLGQGFYFLDNERVSVAQLCARAVALDASIVRSSARPGLDVEVDTRQAAHVLRAHGHRVSEQPDPA